MQATRSRSPPEPIDIFLDNKGFYRKQTVCDSSSLFRAISEQLFGSQISHEQVRSDCIDYMLKYRDVFAKVSIHQSLFQVNRITNEKN